MPGCASDYDGDIASLSRVIDIAQNDTVQDMVLVPRHNLGAEWYRELNMKVCGDSECR